MTKGEIISEVIRHGMDKYLNPDTGLDIFNKAQSKIYSANNGEIYRTSTNIIQVEELDKKAEKLAKRYIDIYHKKYSDYWVNKHFGRDIYGPRK